MSLKSSKSTLAPEVEVGRGLWVTLPLAAIRLSRMSWHVCRAYLRSFWVWPKLDAKGREAECLMWSQQLLRILGIELRVQGAPRPGGKLVVSNHVSWLDIVVINAVVPSQFVSKAEVAQWPVVGRLVSGAGTLYLARERRRDALRVVGLMAKSLREGQTVAVFPEGTTGDGHGVLHFHANMLQAAVDANVPVQPVALRYADSQRPISARAAYVGEMTLLKSVWQIVSAQGLVAHVQVISPQATTHADRRALAHLLQDQIEAAIAN